MSEGIQVSIICITYNHEKFISNMLDSVLSQNVNFEYEILIHDDASKDRTQDIIKDYTQKYPNIIKPILQKENQFSKGINPNITYNYPRIQGKYVAYCEGDDYWSDKNKLQLQYDAMEQNKQCAICVHKTQCVSISNEKLSREFPPIELNEGVISSREYITMELQKVGWLFQTSSYFIRADVVKEYTSNYVNKYPVGDLPLVLFSLQNGSCYYIPKKMSCYRVDSGGAMSSLKSRKKKIAHFNKMIAGHKDFDELTSYKYHDDFLFAILSSEFEINLVKKNYKILISSLYRDVLRKMNIKRKLIIYLGVLCPTVADYIEEKKNGWTE